MGTLAKISEHLKGGILPKKRRGKYMNTVQCKMSKVEIEFIKFLDPLDIKYESSYRIKNKKKIFDYCIPSLKILIEIDGDYWHCKPGTKYEIPKYKAQKRNVKNDLVKNRLALVNGYTLLRFWESDIHNDPKSVKKLLESSIKSKLLDVKIND